MRCFFFCTSTFSEEQQMNSYHFQVVKSGIKSVQADRNGRQDTGIVSTIKQLGQTIHLISCEVQVNTENWTIIFPCPYINMQLHKFLQ